MEIEKIIARAIDAGFTNAAGLDGATITLRPEVREMCASGKCGNYGKSWACPPGCGTLTECAERISRFDVGLIVQTTGTLEDELDSEGMMEASRRHGEAFRGFAAKLREGFPGMLAIGSGSCRNCRECAYPAEPCRDPDGATASMEALGMLVSDICAANGIRYYYGKNTITYVGCYLLY